MSVAASTPSSVKSYLDRYDIGKLFEDMMSKLIMEMPNEPIGYLIKLLQKTFKSRNEGGNTYPSTVLSRPGMSLAGAAMPLKRSSDPHKVIPGGKSSTRPWVRETTPVKENTGELKYEKPWLSGSKLLKTSLKSEQKNEEKVRASGDKADFVSWDTSTKPCVNDDDLDEKPSQSDISLKRPVSTMKKDKETPRMGKDVLDKIAFGRSLSRNRQVDDELPVIPLTTTNDNRARTVVCSPKSYSKFKGQISKRKSPETKRKLQALLSVSPKERTPSQEDEIESDYEGSHAYEDEKELEVEGARVKASRLTKVNKRHHNVSVKESVKVTICPRCANVMNSPLSPTDTPRGVFSDSEEFVSVSQLNGEKSYKPKWTVAAESELTVEDNKSAENIKEDYLTQKNIVDVRVEESYPDFFLGSELAESDIVEVMIENKSPEFFFGSEIAESDIVEVEVKDKTPHLSFGSEITESDIAEIKVKDKSPDFLLESEIAESDIAEMIIKDKSLSSFSFDSDGSAKGETFRISNTNSPNLKSQGGTKGKNVWKQKVGGSEVSYGE